MVTPRKGRVSRNITEGIRTEPQRVTPRKGRVSRNVHQDYRAAVNPPSRLARGV